MNGGCHCGTVTIRVPGRPEYLNACNCTLCTKLGAMWGYYPASMVEIAGETGGYVRADMADPSARFHFCPRCGATTHWSSLAGKDRAGVNMRQFDAAALRGIEVRYTDELNYDADAHRSYRASTIFDGHGAEA